MSKLKNLMLVLFVGTISLFQGCSSKPEYSSYRIETYLENIYRTDYELYAAFNYEEHYLVGSTAYANTHNYLGYELNTEHPDSVLSGIVKKDGSLVLKEYYKRSTYLVRFVGYDDKFLDFMWLPEFEPNTLLPEPAKPQDSVTHTFLGWYKDKELMNTWNFTTDLVTDDTILYSKWGPRTYTITFDPGEGTVELSTKLVTYGETYGELPTPIPTNPKNKFVAWKTTDIYGWPLSLTITENSDLAWLSDHTLTAVYTHSF